MDDLPLLLFVDEAPAGKNRHSEYKKDDWKPATAIYTHYASPTRKSGGANNRFLEKQDEVTFLLQSREYENALALALSLLPPLPSMIPSKTSYRDKELLDCAAMALFNVESYDEALKYNTFLLAAMQGNMIVLQRQIAILRKLSKLEECAPHALLYAINRPWNAQAWRDCAEVFGPHEWKLAAAVMHNRAESLEQERLSEAKQYAIDDKDVPAQFMFAAAMLAKWEFESFLLLKKNSGGGGSSHSSSSGGNGGEDVRDLENKRIVDVLSL